MLEGKKHESNKKWLRLGLLKIRSKSGHSKVHIYLLINFFVVMFFNLSFFFHHVSYIECLLKILR